MKKPCETQSMARLWLHLLLDSAWRGWLALLLIFLQLGSQIDFLVGGKQASGIKTPLWAAFNILVWGAFYAFQQYPAYPLLAALPLSRATRGRFVWAQHVLLIPALFIACILPLPLVQAALGYAPSYTLLDFVLLMSTTVPPALILLIWNRPPLNLYIPLIIYILTGYFGWYIYTKAVAGDPVALSTWPLQAMSEGR